MSAVEKSSQRGSIKTEMKTSKSLARGITETIKINFLSFQISKKVDSR